MRILAGKKDGARRTAHRGVGEGVLKDKALPREPVDMRSAHILVAHIPQRLCPELVGHDEKDVRPSRGSLTAEQRGRSGHEKLTASYHGRNAITLVCGGSPPHLTCPPLRTTITRC